MKVVVFQAKGRKVESGIRNEKLEVRNGNFKLQISSYQLRITILFESFTGAGIIRCGGDDSAFQAASVCCVFVRRSMTRGYEGCCLSGKGEESGKWKVESGKLKVESGGWGLENCDLAVSFKSCVAAKYL